MAEVIVALDLSTGDEARAMVERLGERADFFKVGLELYTRAGPTIVEELIGQGKRVFLDLKLHDIPHTVSGAVRSASALGVDLLTVHAAGGAAMGVTVLTSLTPKDLSEAWGRRIHTVRDEVGRLTELVHACDLHGVVASPLEASWLRRRFAEPFLIVTPGVRPTGSHRDDQTRTATPAEAAASGADFLVVGRPVIRAADPAQALASVLDEAATAIEQTI
jgi:orotidine-5'-phosphate decarboxylase